MAASANLSSFPLSGPAPLDANRSAGGPPRPDPPLPSVFRALALTLLGALAAATLAWNLLVLATIARVRALHREPHTLVASMAAADALVAALVMPLGLAHELWGRRWRLGRRLCRLWVASDVLCCTASIWSVAAVALDRYWATTRHPPRSPRARRRAARALIALAWALSAAIALAPLPFGWGEAYSEGAELCQVSREPSYTVFSTVGAFYLPLGVVLFVYGRLCRAARRRLGAGKAGRVAPAPGPEPLQAKAPAQTVFTVRRATVTFQTEGDSWREQKEQRAALTVGILIGVFALCWTPFFATELASPLCSCDVPALWKSVFLWLGYSNSFFNPLIYTAFSRSYSSAFRSLFSRQR